MLIRIPVNGSFLRYTIRSIHPRNNAAAPNCHEKLFTQKQSAACPAIANIAVETISSISKQLSISFKYCSLRCTNSNSSITVRIPQNINNITAVNRRNTCSPLEPTQNIIFNGYVGIVE